MGKRKVALAFADTSNADESKATRRSRRIGHVKKKAAEPSDALQSDSDDEFVTLIPMPHASNPATNNGSTASSSQRGHQQEQRTDTKAQQKRQSLQREEELLRQKEEDEIRQALELSRREMASRGENHPDGLGNHSQPRHSHQEPLQAARTPTPQDSQLPSGQNEEMEVTSQNQLDNAENMSNSSSETVEDSSRPPSQEVGQSGFRDFTEWQEAMSSADWDDPSVEGVANGNRGTQNSSERDYIPNAKGHKRKRNEYQDGLGQDTADMVSQNRRPVQSKLGKWLAKDERSSPAPKPQKVPLPPDPSSLDQLDEEDDDQGSETEEEVDVTNTEKQASSSSSSSSSSQSSSDSESLEVQQLVDTRKSLKRKHPFYAPLNVNKQAYTKVIYQLIQAYCLQLRQAQAKVQTRIGWGKPVVTGNCYGDALFLRKRGNKTTVFFVPSDDSDEDEAGTSNNTQGNPRPAVSQNRMPLKTRLQNRLKKKPVLNNESDSDFDDFFPSNQRRKAPTPTEPNPDSQDVVEIRREDFPDSQEDVNRSQDSLSQTLVQDPMESQDFGLDPADISGFDSDFSQTATTRPHASEHEQNTNETHSNRKAESPDSATDIFKTSSATETDNCIDTGVDRQFETDKNCAVNSTVGHDTDSDSFDENVASLNIPKNLSQSRKDNETTSDKNSQNSNSQSISNSQHLSKITRSSATANNETNQCPTSSQIGESRNDRQGIEKSKICSVAADSSQGDGVVLDEGLRQGCTSFEENRFLFYQSMMTSRRKEPKVNDKENPDGENSQQEKSIWKSVDSQKSEDSEKFVDSQKSEKQEQKQSGKLSRRRLKVKDEIKRLDELKSEEQPSTTTQNLRSAKNNPSASRRPGKKSASLKSEFPEESCLNTKQIGKIKSRDEDEAENWEASGEESATNFDKQDDFDDNDGEKADKVQTSNDAKYEEQNKNEDNSSSGGEFEDQDTPRAVLTKGNKDREIEENEDILETSQRGQPQDVNLEEEDGVGVEHGENKIDKEILQAQNTVVCPLCGVKYHMDLIERHASGCSGVPSPPHNEEPSLPVPRPPVPSPPVPRPPVHQKGQAASHKARLLRDYRRLDNGASVSTSTNSKENSAKAGTSGKSNTRDLKEIDEEKKSAPTLKLRAAVKGVQAVAPKKKIMESPVGKRPISIPDEEESSESFSESADHLDASLQQLMEDNNLQIRERKRTRVPDQPAKRQKLASADTSNEGNNSSNKAELTELCFICHKRIPKSLYAKHVQQEIDRSERDGDSEDTQVTPRRGLRRKAAVYGAAGGQTSRDPADYDTDQSGAIKGIPYTSSEDCSSQHREPDSDSGSNNDGDESNSMSTPPGGALFNPRVSESPIRSFRPISKQPMNLIDFKNQFNAAGTAANRSRPTSYKKSGRGRGKKRKRYSRKK